MGLIRKYLDRGSPSSPRAMRRGAFVVAIRVLIAGALVLAINLTASSCGDGLRPPPPFETGATAADGGGGTETGADGS